MLVTSESKANLTMSISGDSLFGPTMSSSEEEEAAEMLMEEEQSISSEGSCMNDGRIFLEDEAVEVILKQERGVTWAPKKKRRKKRFYNFLKRSKRLKCRLDFDS